MNTAIARARTQSGAKFCITVVIKEMIAVHAIPPNKIATERSATDLNPATPQSDAARQWFPVRAAHQTRTRNVFVVAPWLLAQRQRQRRLRATHKVSRFVAIRERRWAGAPKTRLQKHNASDSSENGQNVRRVSCVPNRRADRTRHGLSQRAWLI